MIENIIYDKVSDYIENEINYIKKYDFENCFYDLLSLSNMTQKEKWKVVECVLDDSELNAKLNETIHYYLYHLKKEEE